MSICLITESPLYALFADKVRHDVKILVPPGEVAKELEVVKGIWDEMLALDLDRSSSIVALGGGALLDVAGFAAATYMRGLPLTYIPTTLLAMCDACYGGKTGFNWRGHKNLIGAFYPPKEIIIEPAYLETLPEREFLSGLAEVIKHALIDPSLLPFLREHHRAILERKIDILRQMIDRSLAVKKSVVEGDFQDTNNERLKLNLGHTIGHALEMSYACLHGEAVSRGLLLEAQFSLSKGVASSSVVQELSSLLQAFRLPVDIPVFDLSQVASLLEHDKKRVKGKLMLPLIEDWGKVRIGSFSKEEIVSFLSSGLF